MMKKKHLQVPLQQKTKLVSNSLKSYFRMNLLSDSLLREKKVCQSLGTRSDQMHTQQTMKRIPSEMVWEAISIKGRAGLFFFLKLGITMNGQKGLNFDDRKTTAAHVGV